MTPLLKTLIGVGIVGGGAGLSVGGYYLLKPSEPKTLKEKFERRGITILDYESTTNSTGDGWSEKTTKYDSSENKFEGLTTIGSSGLQNLKNKCKEYLEKTPEEIGKISGLEEKVMEWCTKPKS